MDKHIFNEEQLKRAEGIIRNPLAKLSSLTSSELRDLAVVWCYYSGKIEGNTYTYVETANARERGDDECRPHPSLFCQRCRYSALS